MRSTSAQITSICRESRCCRNRSKSPWWAQYKVHVIRYFIHLLSTRSRLYRRRSSEFCKILRILLTARCGWTCNRWWRLVAGIELTPDSWDEATEGKTVFIKSLRAAWLTAPAGPLVCYRQSVCDLYRLVLGCIEAKFCK